MPQVNQRAEFVPPFIRHTMWAGSRVDPDVEVYMDLNPAQAREVAAMLTDLAAMCERAEGLAGQARRDVEIMLGTAYTVPGIRRIS